MQPITQSPDFTSKPNQLDLHHQFKNFHLNAPVFKNDEGVIYLARYEDCVNLLTHKKCLRSPLSTHQAPLRQASSSLTRFEIMLTNWMLLMDPPRHTEIKKTFAQFFVIDRIKEKLKLLDQNLVQIFSSHVSDEKNNMIDTVAHSIPILTIMHIVGIPIKDKSIILPWIASIARLLDEANNEEEMQGADHLVREMALYFEVLVGRRDILPKDSMIYELTQDGHNKLTHEELIYGIIFILASGHETTKNLIGNTLLLLSHYPEDYKKIKSDPTLLDNLIEEVLRYESPIQKTSRWCHESMAFGEFKIEKGSMVTALIGAANHDPAHTQNPYEFNILRPKFNHIAFGLGQHHCIGSYLARLECHTVVRYLLNRFESIQSLSFEWDTFSSFRSLNKLYLKLH
jgi:cytochrome P450